MGAGKGSCTSCPLFLPKQSRSGLKHISAAKKLHGKPSSSGCLKLPDLETSRKSDLQGLKDWPEEVPLHQPQFLCSKAGETPKRWLPE